MIEREASIRTWHEEWLNTREVGQWTKRLIVDIRKWYKCPHRNLDYYLSQFFTGHGCFKSYTRRIGKADSDACMYCEQSDTPAHTIFHCKRWETTRQEAWAALGTVPDVDSLIDTMISKADNWEVVRRMANEILSEKEQEERRRQAQR